MRAFPYLDHHFCTIIIVFRILPGSAVVFLVNNAKLLKANEIITAMLCLSYLFLFRGLEHSGTQPA